MEAFNEYPIENISKHDFACNLNFNNHAVYKERILFENLCIKI